ncbi:unnamed protein product, partial [Adineta steineri]
MSLRSPSKRCAHHPVKMEEHVWLQIHACVRRVTLTPYAQH